MVSPNPTLYGGEFNALRIPISIYNFFWIQTASVSLAPPYFHSLKPAFLSPRLYTEWAERVIPLMLTAPWLVLLATIGACLIIRRDVRNEWKVFAIAFFIQALLILSWHFLTQRYIGDLLPLMLLLTMFALLRLPQAKIQALSLIIVPIIFISIVSTPLSTIDFHMRAVGDTGAQKANRPLLYKMFYPNVDYSASSRSTMTTVLQTQDYQSSCAVPTQEIIRGNVYDTVFSLMHDCILSLNVTQDNTRIQAIVAISDQRHECEGGSANLVASDQSGLVLYRSNILTQTEGAQIVEFYVKKPTVIKFIYENMSFECLRGFVISPILTKTDT
jgi:hypothetical protein